MYPKTLNINWWLQKNEQAPTITIAPILVVLMPQPNKIKPPLQLPNVVKKNKVWDESHDGVMKPIYILVQDIVFSHFLSIGVWFGFDWDLQKDGTIGIPTESGRLADTLSNLC